jgi:GMP synthase (glutamine-hydrolysing)
MATRAEPVRVAVLQHGASVPVGHLGDVLGEVAIIVRLDLGRPVPDPGDFDAIVVLGGHMGAYDEASHPYLVDEKAMIRDAVDLGVPVLGICLGCQLLADALGGRAFLAPSLEVHYGPCRLTEEGRRDPVVRHLAEPVLSVHQDTWELPPGGTLLAETVAYPQAFRLGTALGIQPHPEVTPEIVAAWLPDIGHDRMRRAGTEPDLLLGRLEEDRESVAASAAAMFGAWLESDVRRRVA